jgi:hypothetical protein
MKYCKKPIVIEAFRFRIDEIPDWFTDKVSINGAITTETGCTIHTPEGWMKVKKGDYIIKGINGEIYPCKPDIFNMTYDLVE